jgi:transposase
LRTERYVLRELETLRREEGTFTIKRLMVATALSESDVTTRSISNMLYRNGIRMYNARRKGVLSRDDFKKRLQFAKDMLNEHDEDFWMADIAFYLDAVSFVYKTNPMDQAKAPSSRVYRRRSEGLHRYCTAKGHKEGTGGKYARCVVAISYGQGVIICEPYQKMTGEFFEDFIDRNFNNMFEACEKTSRLFVQDGDPSQNSAAAKRALERVNGQLLKIPPRSPDLNPIENIFHLVAQQLRADALSRNLNYESSEDFENRVVSTIRGVSRDIIDNTIASTHKRVKLIVKSGGERTKY